MSHFSYFFSFLSVFAHGCLRLTRMHRPIYLLGCLQTVHKGPTYSTVSALIGIILILAALFLQICAGIPH